MSPLEYSAKGMCEALIPLFSEGADTLLVIQHVDGAEQGDGLRDAGYFEVHTTLGFKFAIPERLKREHVEAAYEAARRQEKTA